mmetsp:Transcript_57618/g.91261  ORF Transcript_57618/g.91261 Transcript_57618/m.91261 type:complete len:205 (+) Transcript_57618:64-678(+)
MGKKRKKSSSSSSESEASDASEKKQKKAAPKPKAAGGPRFNAFADSDDEGGAGPAAAPADGVTSKAGLSTATAADAFTKKQWEVVQRLKINYQDQIDKKNKKEDKLRRKLEKKHREKELKKAKELAEEEEAAAEAAASEKAMMLEQQTKEQKEKQRLEQEKAAMQRKLGPKGPSIKNNKAPGQVLYSSDLQIGESHGGGAGANV